MKQVKQLLQESSGERTYRVEPSYTSTNVASQSFDDEDSSQHMTEGICDSPPLLYSVSSTPPLLELASPVQCSFPTVPVTMSSTPLASASMTSMPNISTSLTFAPMTSRPLVTSTPNAPTSLTFTTIGSTLLTSSPMVSYAPITLYGSPPPLQSIHPAHFTNLSMPYSLFVYRIAGNFEGENIDGLASFRS